MHCLLLETLLILFLIELAWAVALAYNLEEINTSLSFYCVVDKLTLAVAATAPLNAGSLEPVRVTNAGEANVT